MKKNILLFLIIQLVNYSCKLTSQEIKIVGEPKEIMIDLKSPVERNLLGAVDIKEIIRLETSPESVIGSVRQIKVCDELLFILDEAQKKVLVFNINGNFLNSIGKPGKGPGELIIPLDFDLIPKEKEIAILDNMKRRILIFDYKGQFLYSIHHKLRVTNIAYKNKEFWLFSGKTENTEYGNYELFCIDMTGKILKKSFKIKENLLNTGFGSMQGHNIFWHKKDKLFFCHMFDYNIYNITENKIIKYSSFNFGKNNISEKTTNRLITDRAFSDKMAIEPSKFIWGFYSFQETDNYYFLWIGGGLTHYYLYYSINNEKFKQVPAASPFDPFGRSRTVSTYNNMFINFMYAHDLVKNRNKIMSMLNNKNHMEILNDIKETDNPVLLLVTPDFN